MPMEKGQKRPSTMIKEAIAKSHTPEGYELLSFKSTIDNDMRVIVKAYFVNDKDAFKVVPINDKKIATLALRMGVETS